MGVHDYATISSRIRVLECALPDKTDLERMLDAPGFEEAFKVLNDTDYSNNLLDIEPIQFKTALEKDSLDLKRTLNQDMPSPQLHELLFCSFDWHNIKVLLKTKLGQVDLPKESLSYLGVLSPEKLKSWILENQIYIDIPKSFHETVDRILKQVQKKEELYLIDFLSDKARLNHQLQLAQQIKNKNIVQYVEFLIKQAHSKWVIRSYLLEKPLSFILPHLTENTVPFGNSWTLAYEENRLESLIEILQKTSSAAASEMFEKFKQEPKMKFFEKALNLNQASFLESLKFVAFGPEVVIAYFEKKMNALHNVKTILTGQQNGLTRSQIQERLKLPY